MRIYIKIPIQINNKTHCANDCRFMAHFNYGRGWPVKINTEKHKCLLFDEILFWDNRYKYHGYKRCEKCIEAE